MYTYSPKFSLKKRKLEQNVQLVPNSTYLAESFDLEISNQVIGNETDQDIDHALVKYDLSKLDNLAIKNGQLNLHGKWLVGLEHCTIPTCISSWNKPKDKSIPSCGFLKICVKFEGSKTKEIGTKYFENRLYAKDEVIANSNLFLSDIWLNICELNSQGYNSVGIFFISNLLTFNLEKITGDVYISSNGNKDELSKKKWLLFMKLFNAFKKIEYQNRNLERIEILASVNLLDYLGGFSIPHSICAFESDNDMTVYDKGIPISKRLSIIPQLPSHQNNIVLKNIVRRPNQTPLRLNILTSILPRKNPKIIEVKGETYTLELLAHIPIQNKDLKSPVILYKASKIKYHRIPENCVASDICVAITDSYSDKLINLNAEGIMLVLNFKPEI